MGDWIYYIGLLKIRDIAARVSIVEEIHTSESLKELLQRAVTGYRADQIEEYLLSQPQRFFNALVVGTYGGKPDWYELSIDTEGSDLAPLPAYIEGTLGILTLDGTETLWAIDGQHRVAGIKQAMEEDPEIGNEEVCVIFVKGITSGSREEDPEGFERTRRLFTTLNRYAKPVSKRDIIALDEDDVVAIITRRLLEEHPLFAGSKISIAQTRSIPPSDTQSFTTIVVLYDVLEIILRDRSSRSWRRFKTSRPPDDQVEAFYGKTVRFWELAVEHFPPLQEMQESDRPDDVASIYRHGDGGHLLFRPIGLLILARALRNLVEQGRDLEEAVESTAHVPMDISQHPWAELLWDTVNRRMITAPENQKVARLLLFHGAGGDLGRLQIGIEGLRDEYAGLLKRAPDEIEIRRYT
jgi:DNA sulfur modification protein DndB